jgi:D-glycero-alpha-D-manno-heptose-7-phosphate kinase
MEIRVTAPNRIDLAGGTTDIYPLYLFMGGGFTVNVAVTVSSNIVLRTRREKRYTIRSEDLGVSVEAADLSDLPLDGPLGLIGRAVRSLPPETGLEIVTRNDAPPGSGLGASSALVVALIAGLLELRGEAHDLRDVVNLAANLETASIGVPTGKQDHIAAAYGGVSLIEFGMRDFSRADPAKDDRLPSWLEQTLILSYTGEGRFSGMNNWEVTRGYIDRDETIRQRLLRLRDVAFRMGRSLAGGEWAEIPALVDEEWNVRRTLAPGVSTPRIEAIMEAARSAGAQAGKICGAGGGGCMITFADKENRAAVERAVTEAGGTVLPFTVARQGLRIW